MRVMVMVKADAKTEAGQLPTERELREMGAFNEELAKAGVMLAGEGLRPSSAGVRLTYAGERPATVTRGPFQATRELLAGYWLLKVRSIDEAIDWLRRAPFPAGVELEVRPLFEAEDFGAEFTPELRQQEDRIRAQIAAQEAAHH